MALPRTKMRIIKKNGQYSFKYLNDIDPTLYTLTELSRLALNDTGKYIKRIVGDKLREEYENTYVGYWRRKPIISKRRGKLLRKYVYSACQYWVRKKETDLILGFKKDSWYGMRQELGDKIQPKKGFLRGTVYENLGTIQQIQARYLGEMNKQKPFDVGSGEYKSTD